MTSGIDHLPLSDHTTPSRSAEVTLPLDAPVEDVWRALTDAKALVNWFPTDAAVDARPGGSFVISWEGQWQWDMTVTDCEPLRRLRMLDRAARPFDANGHPLAQAAPVELALEITLEPRDGGGTVLRLVHSGFGHGAMWDDELDGVTLGWNVELRALRHYLAHHRGRSRCTAHVHATSIRPLAELWDGAHSNIRVDRERLPARFRRRRSVRSSSDDRRHRDGPCRVRATRTATARHRRRTWSGTVPAVARPRRRRSDGAGVGVHVDGIRRTRAIRCRSDPSGVRPSRRSSIAPAVTGSGGVIPFAKNG